MDLILSVLIALAAGACGAGGGCGGCASMGPLPGGRLPGTQTVEGGAQIRVTPRGLSTIASIVKPLLEEQITQGFCLPAQSVDLGPIDIASICETNDGHCVNGCRIIPTLNSVTVATDPNNPSILRAHIDASARSRVRGTLFGGTCFLETRVRSLRADVDIALETDAAGELAITGRPITSFGYDQITIDGSDDGRVCQALGAITNSIVGILRGPIEGFIRDMVSPGITSVIDEIVPKPLGLAGTMNVGGLLGAVVPGVQATLETRLLPGGYVRTRNGGVSIGVITGINADRDPSTRANAQASEPARCVPALPAPALGLPPFGLRGNSRGNFVLDPANQFDGVPDPAADVSVGISESMLDLAGHHLVTSGAACLSIGTATVSQLNLSTIGLLVRSLGELATTRNDPMLLVTRPQRALDFSIGDNTAASPGLSIQIDHLEIDFYAFVFERYVRAFTLDVSLNVGINLDFESANGTTTIRPMLVGISSKNIALRVLNSEFVKEQPQLLERVLPSVFDLVTPLLGNLPEITVPSFAGFQLGDLAIRKVSSAQDEFLAINAQLGASTVLNQLARRSPSLAGAVAQLAAPPATAAPSRGTARLASVETPSPDRVRGALAGDPDGALPRVAFEADAVDASGRELEWSYQLDGGLWRLWRAGGPLVIEDRAFAWQGKYTIGLKSRVKGDYHTVSEPVQFPVIIDSVAPQIRVDKAAWAADAYHIPVFDSVSGAAVAYAFGRPSSTAPETAWLDGDVIRLPRELAAAYADARGAVRVFARDEAGNLAHADVTPAEPPASGGCAAQRGTGAGVVIALLAAGWLARRRRRATTLAVLASIAALAACGGSSSQKDPPDDEEAPSCQMASECDRSECSPVEQPFCVDNFCVCSSKVPVGRAGLYSDIAVAPDGAIWISGYAQSYGDLVVARTTGGRIADTAWEWVDGVPAGPVTVLDVTIRSGIEDKGPDVGMYTSIAVTPDGTPMVSYFDRATGSLKLGYKVGDSWKLTVVDAGTGTLAGATGAVVGMYSSLTLRSDDGRPGIAYLAHVKDASGTRAEVRFASAQTALPTVAGDWQRWRVDSAALPPEDPASAFPLPRGLGLFIDAARQPNQAPIVAYYDRALGDLKVARFSAQAGQFTAPRVLDGSSGIDVGWSPSLAVDAQGVAHIAYAGTTSTDLRYVTDAAGAVPEIVDDGFRIVGKTADGYDKPELHRVGEDASIVLPPGGGRPQVVYQDATTQELLLAQKAANGRWTRSSIAGATDPWPGGYGFFAANAIAGSDLVISTWVVNPPAESFFDTNWVEVFRRPL